MQKKSFRFDKKECVGNTLSSDTSSEFLGNFEGIWGNPGEIPHIGRKALGVYRVNQEICGQKPNLYAFLWKMFTFMKFRGYSMIFMKIKEFSLAMHYGKS